MIQLDADSPVLYSDGHRLIQILNNFLSNAFKFTEKGYVTLKIHHEIKETHARRPKARQYESIPSVLCY